MIRKPYALSVGAGMSAKCFVVNTSKSPHAKLKPVPIESVRLEDRFWAPRLNVLREVTIPSQYEMLEKTGRIDNFRIAAGKKEGKFRGLFFNDSDVYKWVEAASYVLAYERDAEVESLVQSVIDEIVAAQDENGYLNTFFILGRKDQRWTNLRDMHELYCAGHLFQAAIAYYRATTRRKLLNAAIRFADHIADVFGQGKRLGTSGHPEIEMALVELYRETGLRKYLELAQFFLDNRGRGLIGGSPYHIDHKPFRELDEITGHAVRAVYLCCGATDIYMETGEEELLKALMRLWRNMTERRMYITGGLGSRHEGEAFGEDYELPNERAYAETCAAVANVMWNWRMLLATADARFADVMELALYNGALSGISLNGKAYFYVNPLADRGRHRRQPWFECACCPPNIARLIASLPGYFYSTSTEGIWIHLYASGTARISFKDNSVLLIQHTDYPWDGRIRIEVNPMKEDEFSIFLRIPGWCEEAFVSVNQRRLDVKARPGTYLEVKGDWHSGDVIELSLSMPIQLMVAHPHVTYNTCRVAIKRGPLVYCVEQVDNPGYDVWDLTISSNVRLKARFRPNMLNGVVVIEGEAFMLDESIWKGHLYLPMDKAELRLKPTRFVAIPYYAWANRKPGPMIVWIRIMDSEIIGRTLGNITLQGGEA